MKNFNSTLKNLQFLVGFDKIIYNQKLPLNQEVISHGSGQSMKEIGPYSINSVQQCDCVLGMRSLPDNSFDVAIADPPYNASKGGEWKWDNSVSLPGFGGNWSKVMASWDNMPLLDYVSFTTAWLTELKRLVRPTGSIWIHGTYHNIGIINFVLQILNIEIINEIVWYKRNSFPNLSGRRLTASHETILWAHTGKRRQYLFNYEASKNLPCPEDSLKSPGKQMRTVWDIPNNKEREEIKFGKHPTQKPLRLLRRMLNLSAKPDHLCLVPFAGVGSECVAAYQLGLHFLGFEINSEYFQVCKKRLSAISDEPLLLVSKKKFDIDNNSNQSTLGRMFNSSQPIKIESIPSLIKWTGSKRSQAHTIAALMPPYQRYFEPFLGGGALLFLAASPGSIAGDIYGPLIAFWQIIRDDPLSIIDNYSDQWMKLHKDLPNYFYLVRDRFNRHKDPMDLNFLMRTCVNGIVRFNDKGEFNNSFHLSRPGMSPDLFKRIVEIWSNKIKGIHFFCQDYWETIVEAKKGDFIYFDPPYAGNNQRYTANLDLKRFFPHLEHLNNKDVKWALSFDGVRGGKDLTHPVPESLFKRRMFLTSGNSAVSKVLNGPLETVQESLYLNY